jgi:hypothetical protein
MVGIMLSSQCDGQKLDDGDEKQTKNCGLNNLPCIDHIQINACHVNIQMSSLFEIWEHSQII